MRVVESTSMLPPHAAAGASPAAGDAGVGAATADFALAIHDFQVRILPEVLHLLPEDCWSRDPPAGVVPSGARA